MGHSTTIWDQKSEFEVIKDWNNIDQVVLRSPRGASARVSLHGGQVISWRNERAKSSCSLAAILKPPKAMRGGISIYFPQFGNCGMLEQHGFARNRMWSIDNEPHPRRPTTAMENFEFRLRVSLAMDGNLTMVSRIRNIDAKPFSFSFAYHTYLSVSDISEVRIEGLETLDYLDNLCQRERFTEQGDAITFESEVDRVYLGSPNIVAVLDHEKKRTFVIRKEGLPDVVVWNPWERKSKTMVDFGDEEYKQTLCVDGALIERPVNLKPGEEWTAKLELSAIPSTYCSDHLDHTGLSI
uniref:glucose-6-phosphate 1-epimerase n=1 Tax=Ananas comosus var. bracteatus TaxID=296719 RepID=A0A6V7QZ70_ANACO